jgi:diguanylate cyclase (GGDEF)-like protein
MVFSATKFRKILVIDSHKQAFETLKAIFQQENFPYLADLMTIFVEKIPTQAASLKKPNQIHLDFCSSSENALDMLAHALQSQSPYEILFLDIPLTLLEERLNFINTVRNLYPHLSMIIHTPDTMWEKLDSLLKEKERLFSAQNPLDPLQIRQIASHIFEQNDMHHSSDSSPSHRKTPVSTNHLLSSLSGESLRFNMIRTGKEAPSSFLKIDPITNLPNQIALFDILDRTFRNSSIETEKTGIFYININNLRLIDEIFGTVITTTLLQAIASRFKEHLKNADQIIRMEQANFLIACPKVNCSLDCIHIAQRLLQALEHPFKISDYYFYLSGCIGISIHSNKNETSQKIFEEAELALEKAKSRGRNVYQVYTKNFETLNMQPVPLNKLEKDLTRALDEEEFYLVYQPLFSLLTGKLVGLESLIRWHHPQFGIIHPNNFIPFAEESGLIHPIGDYVLKEVCQAQENWIRNKIAPPKLSLNISAVQLLAPSFQERLLQTLGSFELHPSFLELELQEYNFVKYISKIESSILSLWEKGFKISIDNFGIDYSCFDYLKKLPIERFKIDKHFISNIHKNNVNSILVSSFISIAHALNTKITAKGVETQKQIDHLLSIGCDEAQGFYYGKPLNFNEMSVHLKDLFLKKDLIYS